MIMDIEKVREYLRVFHHELGHWFVAKQVGFEPQYIEVDSKYTGRWNSSGVCSTILYCNLNLNEVQSYLIHRQLVLLAGAVFEAAYLNATTKDAVYNLTNGTSINDNVKFVELAIILLNLFCGKYDGKAQELEKSSVELNRDCWWDEINKHREDFVGILFRVCKFEIQDFIHDADRLFKVRLENVDNTGVVRVSSADLDAHYKNLVGDRCFFDGVKGFRRGRFQRV